MIKLICIKNWINIVGEIELIKDKIYDGEGFSYYRYKCVNEFGFVNSYDSSNFITLAEWREQQINEIFKV